MRLIKIVGESMSPTLEHGDYILSIKPRPLRAGFLYVVNHIDLGQIIKRLQRIENNHYYFIGDGEKSTPPALIAPVKRERILARAVLRIGKTGINRL